MQRAALFEERVDVAACPAAEPAKSQELGIADAHVVLEDSGLATWLLPEAVGSFNKLALAAAAGSTCASFGTTSSCHGSRSVVWLPCACPVCC